MDKNYLFVFTCSNFPYTNNNGELVPGGLHVRLITASDFLVVKSMIRYYCACDAVADDGMSLYEPLNFTYAKLYLVSKDGVRETHKVWLENNLKKIAIEEYNRLKDMRRTMREQAKEKRRALYLEMKKEFEGEE